MDRVVRPVLSERYGDKENITILELGPAYTTTIPDTLRKDGNKYIGTDISMPFLRKQREFLNEDGYLFADAHQVMGDTAALPLRDGSVDLVFASNHNLFSRDPDEFKKLGFTEVARVLKKGGEFVLIPWYDNEESPEVAEHLLSLFDIRETRETPLPITDGRRDTGIRKLLILSKK